MRTAETTRLAWFFARLAVKERFVPSLHVKPLVAELFLTDNCNLRCVSCACWRSNTKDELSTREWFDVLDQLARLGMHKVNFTGGEPLLRSDTVEIMAHARDAGIARLHLNSNALLLTQPRIDAVLDAGVRSFNVSVDGPGPVHDLIRGRRGAFDTTIDHLGLLVDRRRTLPLQIRLNFTVLRDNVRSLPDVARLAQRLGVRLYLNLASDRTFLFRHEEVSKQARIERDELAAALREVEELARTDRRHLPRFSDLRYIPKHFSDIVQSDLPCAESQLKLMVHSRGEVGGCWGHDPGRNVRENPLAAIIDGEDYRREHERLFRKQCVGCGSNYSLNLRWRPGTYVQDALWRAGRRSLADELARPAP
jgi:MoaA/NifB/PqqE/SkfB family radical SAM enzyme